MKKGQSVSINMKDIPRALSRILYRYHVVIFVVIVLGSMAVVIFMLNGTIQRATDTTNIAPAPSASFDQDTIKRLEALETDNRQTDITFPRGRINPFSE